MNTVFTILTVLVVIASILLVIVVLLQNAKGEGLASNFVAGNQTFGVRQTADMLEKVTWGLVSFILVVSIISSFTLGSRGDSTDATPEIEKAVTEQPAFPSAPIQQADPTVGMETAPATEAAPAAENAE